MIERLESRLLYRASHLRPVFSVDDAGTLRISGTAGNDTLFVGGKSHDVSLILNGRDSLVHAKVRRAVIYGGGGNDLIDCGKGGEFGNPFNAGETAFPVFVDGGAGRDTIYSGGGSFGHADNTLLGGGGNDFIATTEFGLGPSVYMDGGPGNDQLKFGTIMHGGSGDDVATSDGFYGAPVFTSGLEKYVEVANFSIGQTEVPREQYLSDLSTHDGKLVFTYRLDGEYQRSASGPYLRADGRIGINVTSESPKDGVPNLPPTQWSVTLSDRQTARARQKGLVMSFVSSHSSVSRQDWVVLEPVPG